MPGNPLYHEFTVIGLDRQFIAWCVGAMITIIVLTMANTSVKPISWRCRGFKPAGERARACRRSCALRLADNHDRIAIVLPSASWDKELAIIWTGIAFWQGLVCHGNGLIQWFRNKLYPFHGILLALSLTAAIVVAYMVAKTVIYLAVLLKVACLTRWYELNRCEVPPVIEKWGAWDVCHRIAVVKARKRERQQSITTRKCDTVKGRSW